jgi:hypothetical protein
VAAVVVIGGALWSAWRLWRRGARAGGRSDVSPSRLALGNVIIAVGTLVLSASGTLAGRLGKDTAFALTLVTGVVILFCGFLVATPGRVSRADIYRADLAPPRARPEARSA